MQLRGPDVGALIDIVDTMIGGIVRWTERLAVLGWIGAVVFTLAFTGRWIIEGGIATVAALLILAVLAVPGLVLHLLARMLSGTVDDLREAAGVLRAWAASGGREAKLARVQASVRQLPEATGRVRQVRAGLGVMRTIRSELSEIRSISPPARSVVLASPSLTMLATSIGVVGTMVVCWMAAVMVVVRIGIEIL